MTPSLLPEHSQNIERLVEKLRAEIDRYNEAAVAMVLALDHRIAVTRNVLQELLAAGAHVNGRPGEASVRMVLHGEEEPIAIAYMSMPRIEARIVFEGGPADVD